MSFVSSFAAICGSVFFCVLMSHDRVRGEATFEKTVLCDNTLVGCSGESHRPGACTVSGRNADELGGEAGTVLLCPQVV
jgi:hypothetical protein